MADIADKPTENGTKKDETAAKCAESENKIENDAEDKATVVEGAPEESENGISKLESTIIRQVEYYFGDANLSRDKFLMEQIMKDDDHWVPFSVLITFKRLAAMSTDIDVIANALLKSQEGLIEISEDRTKVRRHPERPILDPNEDNRKEMKSRTAYAKGFPLDATIDDILEFFTPYEKVASVTLRKYFDKNDKKYHFKGSVFAIFEKKEQAQAFIEKDEINYKGRSLIRKWQDEYITSKREEKDAARERERARKEKDDLERQAKRDGKKKIVLPKNSVLHFEGVEGEIKREVLREALDKIDPELKVAYIEYNIGDKEGHIRFQEEGNAEKYLEKLTDKKLKVNDDLEITIRKLDEEEETKFLEKVVQDMLKRREKIGKRSNDKGGNRKRRFGGFNNKAKKQRVGDDDD